MNEVFPVGVPVRWSEPNEQGPALLLQVGEQAVAVADDITAAVWRTLGGEPTFRPDGGFGREELVELVRVRFGGEGSEAEHDAVYGAVDSLVAQEAAAEFDTSDAEQLLQAAAGLRLRGLGGVIGADPRDAGVYHLGISGVIDLPVTNRELELFVRSDSGKSLWSLAEEMSADRSCFGTRTDVDWTSPQAQLPFIFFEVRRMLWHGLALLDLAD
ncbi:hypothetical protein EK0264_11595 [Epidermidibacterium keratini]|uniref:Uncharacterized protein n=1 Tax=Epidermidibacterium keratini TaxID=1891644 RepID=A0A7L4YPN2_9ACTN|nr:hypothetical protein [Epidermidibacterium keratini]QHC00863.1 hypothetical protein EK0264_11595 [Epidermidibacterium keratini]